MWHGGRRGFLPWNFRVVGTMIHKLTLSVGDLSIMAFACRSHREFGSLLFTIQGFPKPSCFLLGTCDTRWKEACLMLQTSSNHQVQNIFRKGSWELTNPLEKSFRTVNPLERKPATQMSPRWCEPSLAKRKPDQSLRGWLDILNNNVDCGNTFNCTSL